jgi:hypothetical protein
MYCNTHTTIENDTTCTFWLLLFGGGRMLAFEQYYCIDLGTRMFCPARLATQNDTSRPVSSVKKLGRVTLARVDLIHIWMRQGRLPETSLFGLL